VLFLQVLFEGEMSGKRAMQKAQSSRKLAMLKTAEIPLLTAACREFSAAMAEF